MQLGTEGDYSEIYIVSDQIPTEAEVEARETVLVTVIPISPP